MGAGRRKQTLANENSPSFLHETPYSTWSRNLSRSQLGGVIFGCKNSTMTECLFKQLFGLPAQHFSYVKNIDPGLPLFLFNYTDRKLHGIFEAASSGQMNINPYAWTSDGSQKTLYPAQVQIRVRLHCQPLPEDQFKPIIIDNYYSHSHFWFELDHVQTNKLMSKLSSLAVAPRTYAPQNTELWSTIFRGLPSKDNREKSEGSDSPVLIEDFVNFDASTEKLDPIDVSLRLNGDSKSLEASIGCQEAAKDEQDFLYFKLKELVVSRGCSDPAMNGHVVESAPSDDAKSNRETSHEAGAVLEEKNDRSSFDSSDHLIEQLLHGMEELKAFKREQTQKIYTLEQKLAEAQQAIQQLKNRCNMLESTSNPSTAHVIETVAESLDNIHLDICDSIFLVGGYDGVQWLSTLDLYSPFCDVVKSLKPMNSVRSYASVAKLNRELYVFGGGNGSLWYDTGITYTVHSSPLPSFFSPSLQTSSIPSQTSPFLPSTIFSSTESAAFFLFFFFPHEVESYNPAQNQWTWRPSLNGKKGSLAGATWKDKIFALGGGDGIECFSNVEMFDVCVGRWIPVRSMLQRRFALASVDLNGAIYAVGGYDGNDYLKSAERFDPREHSWSRIQSMSTARGCHSLVVMDEKLYALGGYDGSAMVPSIEIYDPRLGTWMMGEPMNQPRGYLAAAVLKDSIYVIGGVKSGEEIVDMIECYKEGEGWQATNLKAIGRRCFSSAIVLGED